MCFVFQIPYSIFIPHCTYGDIHQKMKTHPALFGGILNRKLHQWTRILIAFLHLHENTARVIHMASTPDTLCEIRAHRETVASKLKVGLTGRSWARSKYTVKMAAEGGSAVLPKVVMFWFFWSTCGIKQGLGKPNV